MHSDDVEMIAFWSTEGVCCYQVMLFSLKNAGATYQRAMNVIFKEMLRNIVECYVDDLVVKSHRRIDRLEHLWIVVSKLRQHQLKMNP